MDLLVLLSLISLMMGLFVFSSLREHLLVILLSLEFMVISLFLLLLLGLSKSAYFYSLIYLIITACEGALGLSLLVVMGRTHGGDYFSSLDFIL